MEEDYTIDEIIENAVAKHADKIKPCQVVLDGEAYPRFCIEVADKVWLKSNVTLFNDGTKVGYCTILNATGLTDEQVGYHAASNMIVQVRNDVKKTSSKVVEATYHLKQLHVEMLEGRARAKEITPEQAVGAIDVMAKSHTLEQFLAKMTNLPKDSMTSLWKQLNDTPTFPGTTN